MTRPEVAGRDDLQIWKVDASVLNKQSWAADIVLYCLWYGGCGLQTPRRKRNGMLRNVTEECTKFAVKAAHGEVLVNTTRDFTGSIKSGRFLGNVNGISSVPWN
jgi:hypothetical protein